MSTETSAESVRKIDRGPVASGCPVHVGSDGTWHVRDYAGARALLRSTDTRQAGFGIENGGRPGRMRPPVLFRDGAEHREHRRQTAKFFTPRRVDEKYRELMHRYAEEQCARLRRRGSADLSELSFALAVAVAGEVIGLTPARRGMARRLDRFFLESRVVPGWTSPAGIARLAYQHFALGGFYVLDVRPAIAARRRERRDDLISHLLDEGCTNPEILGECVTFAAAGMITTREFITLVAWHLFSGYGLRSTPTNWSARSSRSTEARRSRSARPRDLRRVVVRQLHDLPARALGGEPVPEGRPVVRRVRRPAEFGDRGQPREGHVVDVGVRHDRLCPQWSLDAEDGRAGYAGHVRARVPAVRLVHLGVAGPVLAQLRRGRVLHVEVRVVGRREDQLRTVLGGRGHGGVTGRGVPELGDRGRQRRRVHDVVPAEDRLAVPGDDLLYPVDELGVVGRLGRLRLVATDVQVRAGGQRGELTEYGVDERVRDVLADAQRAEPDVGTGVARRGLAVAVELGGGGQRGVGVAGHVDLGD